MKKPSPNKLPSHKRTLGYVAVLAVTLAVAIVLGWTSLAAQIDDDAYDVMFRLHPPPAVRSRTRLILAIDDATFGAMGGVRAYRTMLAKALELLTPAEPKVVAMDMVLADQEDRPKTSDCSRAMQSTTNLVLVAHLQNGHWEDPLDKFRRACHGNWGTTARTNCRATASPGRSRSKSAPNASATGRWRWRRSGWLAAQRILESPGDLQIGNEVIPAPRTADNNRSLRVLFTREPIPQVSLLDLVEQARTRRTFSADKRCSSA